MLRFVKFKPTNRLYRREQEGKNYFQSRTQVQFKAVGLEVLFFGGVDSFERHLRI